MTATPQQAQDEIFAAIWTVWQPTGHLLNWPNRAPGEERPADDLWGRVTIRHSPRGGRMTLGPVKRHTREGRVYVQIFAPAGEGLARAYAQAKIVADALEAQHTPSGVWFRSCYTRDIGPDAAWYQVNVECDFSYDEIK